MIERLEIEISRICGLRCLHCSIRAMPTLLEGELTYSDWKRIINDFAALGGKELVITGGEPLLHKDLFKLIELARRNGLAIRLYTAGYPVNAYIAQQLSSVDLVCVSLEGLKATHEMVTGIRGSYDRTIQGLRFLRSAGVRVRLHFTPIKLNFREFEHVIDIANEFAVESVKVLKFVPEGRGKDNERLLTLSPEGELEFSGILSMIGAKAQIPIDYGGEVTSESKCSMGTKLLITADGYALPCLGLRDCLWLSAGNVRQQDLRQICMKLKDITKDGQCICAKIHVRA